MRTPDQTSPLPPRKLRAARGALTATGLVAAAFGLAVVLLMVADWARYRATDPTELPALQELRERYRDAPDSDELRDEIRQLDALARRAHFSSVTFRQRGAGLLLGAGVVLLLALAGRRSLSPTGPAPVPWGGRSRPSAANARRLVAGMGILVAGLALLLALLFQPETPLPSAAGDPQDPARHWDARLEHWPSFRGPDGLARSSTSAAPLDWDGATGRNLLWKVPVPLSGFGSPVVWGDRIFVTGADEQHRAIYAYDNETGQLLWTHDASVQGSHAVAPRVTADTGHAASTPATDGQRVYALFSNGDLVAVDLDGQRAWSRQLGVPENPYGHAASLLVWRHLLIVQYDQRGGSRLLALDAASGSTAWEVARDLDVSWSTPILIEHGGQEQLVLNGNPWVVAYEPPTGLELWRAKVMRGELAPSPAFGAGKVFVANQYARLAAIEPGDLASVGWEHSRDLPEVSSPAATDALVFIANGYGAVSCLDAFTGALQWRHEFDEGFYASPVVVGERVYLMDRSGVMRILAASRDFRLLGSPALGEPSDATAAFIDDRIYLRGKTQLYAVRAVQP